MMSMMRNRTDSNDAGKRRDVSLRPARREEAPDIARLFLISSDGLAAYIWGGDSKVTRPLEDIGAARYAREGVAFSYQNCLLATRGQDVLGMVHAFPMQAREANDVESDPVLRPYAELEDPGSLYISGLAVYPQYRRQGIGDALMQRIETTARERALPRLSLICFERNEAALNFYLLRGYAIVARRPVVPHPALHYCDGDALLMVRPVIPSAGK